MRSRKWPFYFSSNASDLNRDRKSSRVRNDWGISQGNLPNQLRLISWSFGWAKLGA